MDKTKAHQRYKLKDGTIVPGVTTILNESLGWNKQALIAWSRKMALAGKDPNKVTEQAADIGTIAHYLVECHIKGDKPDLTQYAPVDVDKAESCFLAYLDWEKRNNVKDFKSEIRLVSEHSKFGGTADLIANVNGKRALIDFKTSSGIYTEHKVQTATYFKLARENDYDLEQAFLLHLGKNGEFAEHRLSRIELYWEVFVRCLALYKLKRQIQKGA